MAGLCVAGLMLPEAVAYAGIAGLPPQHAIFAGIAGCLAYALVGQSRFAVVSATSSSAAILAATLAVVPLPGGDRAALGAIIVGMTGLLFLVAAAARLGGLTGFISRPVLRGFAFGIAVTIILHQLPIVTGVGVPSSGLIAFCTALARSAPGWHAASVATGVVAFAVLLALRRYPAIPGAFLVLVAGIAASHWFALQDHGVAMVGAVDTALAWPSLPRLAWGDYSRLAQLTVPLVLILFAESWGTIRTLALRHGDAVDANRELGALGIANLASSMVQGMPVGAGFSAGSASEAAGSTSRMTSLVAATGLIAMVLVAMPLIAFLPEPVLAAVVIAALTHALDPAPILRLWRLDRDQYVALGAALGVLLLGVLNGMLLAIALSLAALLQRLATPRVARLGRLGDSHDYVDVARHADAIAPQHIAIWRPTAPLFFANAERMLGLVATGTRTDPALRAVILSLEESYDLDSTALDALIEFDGAMVRSGFRVQLARLHDRARDLIAAAGETDLDRRSSYSVDDAVSVVQATLSDRETEDFAPALRPVEIATLRPTQMTVGLREVERKRADWRKHADRDGPDFLGRHMIPVIIGPKSVPYVIDHHHLLRALHDEGVSHVLVSVIADLHYLKKTVFWTFLDNRNWLHPFDAEGVRQSHDDLPKHVGAMKDDPYRSLAGELRRSGGYAKDDAPYSEFLWADFLRRRISRKLIENDFERSVVKALDVATQAEASYLPGWCGRSGDTDR